MDGNYPRRQFVSVIDNQEENTEATATAWAKGVVDFLNSLPYKHKTNFRFGGDITGDQLQSIDSYLLNKDVVTLAKEMYSEAVEDDTFFEYGDVVADFFSASSNPRGLFGVS